MSGARPVLVVATRNPGKVAEFARLLATYPWDVEGLDDVGFEGDIEEPFDSYAENARVKADTVCAATGKAVIADDSGIEVIALRGWPGVHSARWMGAGATDADRLAGLLAEVAQRSPTDTRVRYVAALALARPGVETVVAHGSCDGVVVDPRGEGGFGYDPSFLSNDLGVTFAEASQAQKDGVSHRARALRRLADAGLLSPPLGYGLND